MNTGNANDQSRTATATNLSIGTVYKNFAMEMQYYPDLVILKYQIYYKFEFFLPQYLPAKFCLMYIFLFSCSDAKNWANHSSKK